MKRLFLAFVLALGLSSCDNTSPIESNTVSIDQVSNDPKFNVPNFVSLLKSTTDVSKLEAAINTPGNNINNLDENNDQTTDFLKVDESQGVITVTDNDVNPSLNIVTMTVTPNGNQANVNIQGSQQYCGNDYNYHSSFTFGDYLLLSYMLRPHVFYHPAYVYGYHPAYYHPTHVRTVRTVQRDRSAYNTPSNNPAQNNRRSDVTSSPDRSQRSFKRSDNNGGYRNSAFGGSDKPKSSFGGGNGGGKSSFGGGRSTFGKRK